MASLRHALTIAATAVLLLACGTPSEDGADARQDGDAQQGGLCAAERPASCGDGACRADQGETPDSCRRDCVPESCGNGDCQASRGETPDNCAEDCNDVCLNDRLRPVYCKADGGCWEEGSDCCAEPVTCGGRRLRCAEGDRSLHCCGDFAASCGGVGAHAYFCPAPGMRTCVASADQCPVPVCEVLATCGDPPRANGHVE